MRPGREVRISNHVRREPGDDAPRCATHAELCHAAVNIVVAGQAPPPRPGDWACGQAGCPQFPSLLRTLPRGHPPTRIHMVGAQRRNNPNKLATILADTVTMGVLGRVQVRAVPRPRPDARQSADPGEEDPVHCACPTHSFRVRNHGEQRRRSDDRHSKPAMNRLRHRAADAVLQRMRRHVRRL